MIKVFITVGTTPFDSLIQFCDENIDTNKFDVLAQVSSLSKYKAKNIKTIEFSNKIKELYFEAEIVISHAGAGSVYNLLEMQKKTIFVPNYTMKDNHQDDICKYVKYNNFGEVMNLQYKKNINKLLELVYSSKYNIYKNKETELHNTICNLLK